MPMTPDFQYQAAVILVVGYKDSNGNRVKGALDFVNENKQSLYDGMWCPFQILYVEMAKRKEIKTLSELPEEEKREYWNEAKKNQPGEMKWRQMWVAQALYLYDLITHENDNEIIRVREAD